MQCLCQHSASSALHIILSHPLPNWCQCMALREKISLQCSYVPLSYSLPDSWRALTYIFVKEPSFTS